MSDNSKTDLWDRLGRTDPEHTKKFQRAGGFKGTAIKPMWSFHRMTEEFVACGVGWGVNKPEFQVVETNDETLVFCTVSIWHGAKENIVFGVGGDKAMLKQSSGIRTDDEAFKKAFTDAITNALKLIGVGADVHMGLFDDNKYVNEMKTEFAGAEQGKRQNPHVTRPEDIGPTIEYDQHGQPIDNIPLADPNAIQKLRVADQRPIFATLQDEIQRTGSEKELTAWAATNKDRLGSLKPDWQANLRGVYAEHLQGLRALAQGDDMRMAG